MLWYAGAQAAFVVFAFLPAVVYFFNTAFVEYPLMDHYVFAFPIAVLIFVIPLAVAVIPRAPRRLILSVCRFVVTYIVIASIFFPSSTPALDGEEQFADILSRASIQSHLVLGILAVAIITALSRWPDQTKTLSHAMFAAAIAFVAYTVIPGSKQEDPDAGDLVKQDIERLVTYSRPPPDGVSVLSLSEHASRKRTFIAYRNSRGVAERNGLRPEDIQTFSLSGSVEDLDKVTDSAGGRLR
jgi:hypothetical protein